MVKPPLRTKSIGFKVSQEEYAQLETAVQASGRTLGEWCREVILRGGSASDSERHDPALAEIVGVRLLLVLVCLALASCMLCEGGCRASKTLEPSDQSLISAFRGHRQAFGQIQEMASEDAQRGWYLGASDPSKLEQSRRDGYKKLISEIRPELQVAMDGTSGHIRFIFAGEGTAIGPGWVKGIEYVPGDYSREGVLLPDLSKAAGLPANVYIRQIEPKWLIFYQRDE